MGFLLSACVELLWPERPVPWRCARLREMGFGVGLWNAAAHDIDALIGSAPEFSPLNGLPEGRLGDTGHAERRLASARSKAVIGLRLGVARLNRHGSAPGSPRPRAGPARSAGCAASARSGRNCSSRSCWRI